LGVNPRYTSDRRWKNVDIDMEEALDRRDANHRGPLHFTPLKPMCRRPMRRQHLKTIFRLEALADFCDLCLTSFERVLVRMNRVRTEHEVVEFERFRRALRAFN
jgi:hypothetical protein